MDHLERPSNPRGVDWPIPLLCKGGTSDYTLENFKDYPKNHVSPIQSIVASQEFEVCARDIVEWLTFT